MSEPLISVLIPMYNAGEGVRRTLQSISEQTIDDYEVVIIDDGSTDNSSEIALNTYPEAIIISQENTGITKALNHGLEYCKGKFIARLDCFDISEPDRLESQAKVLIENRDLGAVGGHLLLYENDGNELGVGRFPITPNEARMELLSGNSPLPHSGAMIRMKTLIDVGRYDPFYNGREDFELWCRLSLIADLANLDKVVVRSFSSRVGISYEGALRYPLVELALIERAERMQKGLDWVNRELRNTYSRRMTDLIENLDDTEWERNTRALFHLKRAGFLLRSGSRAVARREYIYTIRSNPKLVKAYFGLLSTTIFPISVYMRLLQLYKRFRSPRPRGRS
jgi:glycosyltransferase involved in cell wall biosynthesis